MEIKTTEQIFNELCDDCGTGFHQRPKDKWVSVDSLKPEIEAIRVNCAQNQLRGHDTIETRQIYEICNAILNKLASENTDNSSEVAPVKGGDK